MPQQSMIRCAATKATIVGWTTQPIELLNTKPSKPLVRPNKESIRDSRKSPKPSNVPAIGNWGYKRSDRIGH